MSPNLFARIIGMTFVTGLAIFFSSISFSNQLNSKARGKVISLEVVPINSNHPEGGIHLKLRSGKSNWTVHLGPNWIKDNQNLGLGVGDEIVVIGATVRFGKKTELSPSDIRKIE